MGIEPCVWVAIGIAILLVYAICVPICRNVLKETYSIDFTDKTMVLWMWVTSPFWFIPYVMYHIVFWGIEGKP